MPLGLEVAAAVRDRDLWMKGWSGNSVATPISSLYCHTWTLEAASHTSCVAASLALGVDKFLLHISMYSEQGVWAVFVRQDRHISWLPFSGPIPPASSLENRRSVLGPCVIRGSLQVQPVSVASFPVWLFGNVLGLPGCDLPLHTQQCPGGLWLWEGLEGGSAFLLCL